MSTTNRPRNVRETHWQRTCRVFLAERVRITLRGGGMLEGELEDPQAFSVILKLLAGGTRLVDYGSILAIEVVR